MFERAGKGGRENPALAEMERYAKILADVAAGTIAIDSAAAVSGSIADPADDADDPSEFYNPSGI